LLSPEGRCFAFDSRASGYGRGEGAATIILKPLVDAVRDGDPIRAVIRETAANQDGRTPTITSPSREAQEELVRACYRKAGLDPSRTGYAEAHGTGTIVGDYTEAGALGTVLGRGRSKKNPLLLGSVKTNIGHTEAASGLAGVIKVVLALEKGCIPPSINLNKANSTIPFDELNIKIPRQVEFWPSESLRRASVNNFGYGGANAHAIIEDPTYLIPRAKQLTNGSHLGDERQSRIFTLSAKDEVAGRAMATNLRKYLSEMGETRDSGQLLDQLAYTLGQRRSHFSWNAAVPAKNLTDLTAALSPEEIKFKRTLREPRLGFVFTGQGAQWYAMGRELISLYPVFREALEETDNALHELGARWSLIGLWSFNIRYNLSTYTTTCEHMLIYLPR
jgi:acyl transferase domain-containing protein